MLSGIINTTIHKLLKPNTKNYIYIFKRASVLFCFSAKLWRGTCGQGCRGRRKELLEVQGNTTGSMDLWSQVQHKTKLEKLEHFMLLSGEKFRDFFFNRTLPTLPKYQYHDDGTTVLDWQANGPELNPLWGFVEKKKKAYVKAGWSLIPQQIQCRWPLCNAARMQ